MVPGGAETGCHPTGAPDAGGPPLYATAPAPDLARDAAVVVRALMKAMLHAVASGDRTTADVHRIMDPFIDLLSERPKDPGPPPSARFISGDSLL